MKGPGFDAVLKLGGSLYHSPALRLLLGELARAARRERLLVVPGGSSFADAVRRAWRACRLSERAAHRMALLGMDQFGLLLCDLQPRAVPVRTLGQARRMARARRLPVLLAARLAAATRDLPASWDVTSDSVAAWIARRLGARRLVLLKSVHVRRVPGRGLTLGDLVRRGVVDRAFPRFAAGIPECWIVNGSAPDRAASFFRGEDGAGTRVITREARQTAPLGSRSA